MTRKSLGNAPGNIQVHQVIDDGFYVKRSVVFLDLSFLCLGNDWGRILVHQVAP